MSLVYNLKPGGPTVVLTDDAISSMSRHLQKSFKDREAGGQLFARFDGSNTVIVAATEPKPLDTRSRYGFVPSQWLQRLEIKAQHKKGKHFVGDWHSHPQPVPHPSDADINSMVDCFCKSRHELKAFLMVIVGTAEPPEGIFVCLVDEHGITKLQLISERGCPRYTVRCDDVDQIADRLQEQFEKYLRNRLVSRHATYRYNSIFQYNYRMFVDGNLLPENIKQIFGHVENTRPIVEPHYIALDSTNHNSCWIFDTIMNELVQLPLKP